eukprot:2539829-Pyramimonas_sp.AAC.1
MVFDGRDEVGVRPPFQEVRDSSTHGGVPRGSTEIEIPAVDLPADLSLQDEDHLSEEIKEKRLELAEKDALLLAER